jgi:hypothetical protein
VIPRLGKDLHRVCDSCYQNVHSDPCSELFENLSEINYQEKIKNEALRVAVISTSDVVAQAIVQGISIALTGSPLGKEIDIHCFPTPDLSFFPAATLENADPADPGLYNPPVSSLPPGIISRHSISPHFLSYPSPASLHSEQHLSFLRNSLTHNSPNENLSSPSEGRTAPFGFSSPPRETRPPLLETNDRECKISACQKAKLAYKLYQERFDRLCDYAVGIVFCVVRDTLDEDLDHSTESDPEAADPFQYHSDSYHIYYWIAIFDGTLLNTSRSASIVLPPSLCAHIQRKKDHHPHLAHSHPYPPRSSLEAERGTDEYFPSKPLPTAAATGELHCEIDIEEELIAAILRLGESGGEDDLTSPAPLGSNRNSQFSIAHALSGGIVGWLTSGKITRAHYLQSAVQLAFIPFQWRDLFEVTDV